MEKERIQPARNSRTIQQRNAGSANIMDNRPDGSRNYLSATPVQRVEEDDEDVLQGKLSTPAQRVESEEDDEVETAVQRKKKGLECNTIQGLIVPPQLIHFLQRHGIDGVPLQQLIDSMTRNTGVGGGFGATGYSWNGRTVYHETFANIAHTVFYSYYQNRMAVVLGIGFHAGGRGARYNMTEFTRGGRREGRTSINLRFNGEW